MLFYFLVDVMDQSVHLVQFLKQLLLLVWFVVTFFKLMSAVLAWDELWLWVFVRFLDFRDVLGAIYTIICVVENIALVPLTIGDLWPLSQSLGQALACGCSLCRLFTLWPKDLLARVSVLLGVHQVVELRSTVQLGLNGSINGIVVAQFHHWATKASFCQLFLWIGCFSFTFN